MDIFGIIKNLSNLKNDISLQKNKEEKTIKEINLKEEDIKKIVLNPIEEDFFAFDSPSSSLLDEWFSREGVDVLSEDAGDNSSTNSSSEDFDPDKTLELPVVDDEFDPDKTLELPEVDPDKTEELTLIDGAFDPDKTAELPLTRDPFANVPPPEDAFPNGDGADPFADVLVGGYDPFSNLPPSANKDEDLEDTLEPFGGNIQIGATVVADDWEETDGWEDDFSFDKFAPPPAPTTPPPHPSEIPLPPFEPQLNTSTLGMYQSGFHTPDPIGTGESILPRSVKELESMAITSLRALLIDELEELENVDENKRKAQLQKIFNALFCIQPTNMMKYHVSEDFLTREQRLYIDIISDPEIYQMPMVREFLDNDFYSSTLDYSKKLMLKKIYSYYDTHSHEAIEKFWETQLFVGLSGLTFSKSLEWWVNDVLGCGLM